MTLAEYVQSQVTALIQQVRQECDRAALETSDEAIHDLRVAIRRLSENLRVFKDLFPKGAAKAVRRDLKAAMKLAGETRNHDIARELMTKARVPVTTELKKGREQAAGELAKVLNQWNQDTRSHRWQAQLRA
jgi:CHAD domain-containing protein